MKKEHNFFIYLHCSDSCSERVSQTVSKTFLYDSLPASIDKIHDLKFKTSEI